MRGCGRKLSAGSALLCLLLAAGAAADELVVDRRSLSLDESVQVQLVLEGASAAVEEPRLPLQNLTVEHGPSVSTQFTWINGVSSRRKLFRWILVPKQPGTASVGPVRFRRRDGRIVSLSAVTLQVTSAHAAPPGAPAGNLGDRRVVIVGEADRNEVFVGEQITISWYAYTDLRLTGIRVTSAPPLRDFWAEEIPVDEEERGSDLVLKDGSTVERFLLRRVALFPIRSGKLEVGSLNVTAETFQPRESFFGIFEGNTIEIRRRSAPIPITARDVPAGAAAVGTFVLHCTPPRVAGGSVTFETVLQGEGNLRSAEPPSFSRAVADPLHVDTSSVQSSTSTFGRVSMSRKWSFTIFPRRSGTYDVPPVTVKVFNARTGQLQTLGCGGASVDVSLPAGERAAEAPRDSEQSPARRDNERERLPGAGVAVALLMMSTSAIVLSGAIRRRKRARVFADALVRTLPDLQAFRAAVNQNAPVHLLDSEGMEIRDRILSLLALVEREPWELERSRDELASLAEKLGDSLARRSGTRR